MRMTLALLVPNIVGKPSWVLFIALK